MAAMEPYELIRSRRKTLALEITRDCRVVVRPPCGRPAAKSISLSAPMRTGSPNTWRPSAAGRSWHLRPLPGGAGGVEKAGRAVLEPRVAYWSGVTGLVPTGMRITAARTRYGSCSGKNSLSFSCFLVNYPPQAIDLVVVHELCHIRVKNHGPAFYALLEQYLPDYRERRQLLRSPGIPEA